MKFKKPLTPAIIGSPALLNIMHMVEDIIVSKPLYVKPRAGLLPHLEPVTRGHRRYGQSEAGPIRLGVSVFPCMQNDISATRPQTQISWPGRRPMFCLAIV